VFIGLRVQRSEKYFVNVEWKECGWLEEYSSDAETGMLGEGWKRNLVRRMGE
jgi:hypothetical protein